jgi:S1-C subfamily serine protease
MSRRIPSAANTLLAAMILAATILITTLPCLAELYKYQKDGVWYYTDTPPKEILGQSQTMTESSPRAAAPSLEGTPLLTGYVVHNDLERAASATVKIKSAIASGSGFFISSDGYIVTNKHVVRTPSQQAIAIDEKIKQYEGRMESHDRNLEGERLYLLDYKNHLDKIKARIETEPNAALRQRFEEDYAAKHKRYEQRQREYEQQLATFERYKQTFQNKRADYGYRRSVGNLSQSFTITLADNTEVYARLVVISTTHDLALLKLDGYQTPFLTPGHTQQLALTHPVYAIGNPASLHNSVTSGIFSGFENGLLKTNAQIYPGNSGGPLVDAQGRVLGVNTLKQLTRKFEGLGFAIPIETVLREFSAHLPGK